LIKGSINIFWVKLPNC